MNKKGTIIQLEFDSTTSVVMLDKNGKVLYPSTVLKSKHKEIDVPKEAFDDFMNNFKSFENQKDDKKVLSPDFDKWLEKQIKNDKKSHLWTSSNFVHMIKTISHRLQLYLHHLHQHHQKKKIRLKK